MKTPLVSVCVVTCNHARYIRDCLMSVLAQSEDVSLEVLVGDDHSEDETGAIVEELAAKFPSLIDYFRHAIRKGAAENYQFLIHAARGKYIAHLDGDDFWMPGKLRRQLAILEANPELIAVFSNAVVVGDDGALRGGFNVMVPESFGLGYLLRKGNFLCHGSLVYRADARPRLLALAAPFLDYRIHLELASHGKIGYANSALVGYRVASTTSMSVTRSGGVRALYWQALGSVVVSDDIKRDLGSGMAHFTMISCWNALAAGKLKEALGVWKMVMSAQPVAKHVFVFKLLWHLAEHCSFKIGNFISRAVLRRNLKIYFRR